MELFLGSHFNLMIVKKHFISKMPLHNNAGQYDKLASLFSCLWVGIEM
jgi:hypothetical protein